MDMYSGIAIDGAEMAGCAVGGVVCGRILYVYSGRRSGEGMGAGGANFFSSLES